MINNNRAKLINYFQAGAKPKEEKKLGLEIEHFILRLDNGDNVGYYDGVEKILNELAPQFSETIISEGHTIGLKGNDMIITLEPGAQLEVSLAPHRTIHGIKENYRKFTNIITPILSKHGYKLINTGYQPRKKVEEIQLIPKKRYELMDLYFKTKGNHGINMMRGTASTQVSIDYSDEEDFRKIYVTANFLSPLLALLTDNTPLFEGKRYDKYLARTMIWNDVDSSRPVNPDFCLDANLGFDSYADFILNHPCILTLDGNDMRYTAETTVKDLYTSQEMTEADIEHILSMFFPDVRLKNFLEIRMADSMDMPFAISYAALIKGLFYSDSNKDRFYTIALQHEATEIKEAKNNLIEKGYQAEVYGSSPQTILNTLLTFAEAGLDQDERVYLAPLAALVEKKETLAQAAKEYFNL